MTPISCVYIAYHIQDGLGYEKFVKFCKLSILHKLCNLNPKDKPRKLCKIEKDSKNNRLRKLFSANAGSGYSKMHNKISLEILKLYDMI